MDAASGGACQLPCGKNEATDVVEVGMGYEETSALEWDEVSGHSQQGMVCNVLGVVWPRCMKRKVDMIGAEYDEDRGKT